MVDLHTRMMAAVLAGEGLAGVAELAAAEAGGPVAILLPARGLAAGSSGDLPLDELGAYAAERLNGRDANPLPGVAAEHPVEAGPEAIGYVLALRRSRNGLPDLHLDLDEVLRATAAAAVGAVAVSDARDEVVSEIRGSFLEEVRAGDVASADAVRRAARLGCDLSSGAVALVAEVHSPRPHQAAALVRSTHPGAIAEVLGSSDGAREPGSSPGGRIYALLPATGGDDAEGTLGAARSIAARLRPSGPAAFSSLCTDPGDLRRAVAEAELALDVVARDERMAEQLENGMANGVYRLLFRALATDPEEVRRFYEDTVESLVSHDREYRTDLLGTLEAYLGNDCNMNATARALYAHRHTVAHRLDRVRELTGLDPALGEDRERLGLGIKAYRIMEPTLTG
jgi:hypothetical protein